MQNTFGSSVSVTVFGESHGGAIGAILDGIAPGIEVDEEYIYSLLQKRKGPNAISTKRRESDECKILSGVFQGKTTGTPICLLIENENQHSKDYSQMQYLVRPGHADFAAFEKYHGFQDYRGGGHFSGRLTAPIVAAGAIAIKALEKRGIFITTHVLSCAGVSDRPFGDLTADHELAASLAVPVFDERAREEIEKRILKAASEGDSVGGILQTAVTGIPSGVGEPMFNSVESVLSHAMFSIPAVKGVQFGAGFAFADMTGSQANDPFYEKDGKVYTSTNNNGGINGGITNGMPIVFDCVVKPTPSIYKKQQTVDVSKVENTELVIKGRHDPAIVHRAPVVVDSMTALALCDLLAVRYGTDYLKG